MLRACVLTLAAALAVAWPAAPAAAAGCVCQTAGNRSVSSQSGPGFCFVHRQGSGCSAAQLGTGGSPQLANLQRFLTATRSAVPAEALRRAATVPPEGWQPAETPGLLAALLGAAPGPFPDHAAAIRQALSEQAAALWPVFSQPAAAPTVLEGSGYRLAVGYGCIAFRQDDYLAQARTPFAAEDPGKTCAELL